MRMALFGTLVSCSGTKKEVGWRGMALERMNGGSHD